MGTMSILCWTKIQRAMNCISSEKQRTTSSIFSLPQQYFSSSTPFAKKSEASAIFIVKASFIEALGIRILLFGLNSSCFSSSLEEILLISFCVGIDCLFSLSSFSSCWASLENFDILGSDTFYLSTEVRLEMTFSDSKGFRMFSLNVQSMFCLLGESRSSSSLDYLS